MEQHILRLSLITEGNTEKESQFIVPVKSIYNKNVCFNEHSALLNMTERLKQ